MESYLLAILTFLYSAGGIVTFLGFVPTMKDLWLKKPSANITTYIGMDVNHIFYLTIWNIHPQRLGFYCSNKPSISSLSDCFSFKGKVVDSKKIVAVQNLNRYVTIIINHKTQLLGMLVDGYTIFPGLEFSKNREINILDRAIISQKEYLCEKSYATVMHQGDAIGKLMSSII